MLATAYSRARSATLAEQIGIGNETMAIGRTLVALSLCVFLASCRTLTPRRAEGYLRGKWRFDRQAEDHGYFDGLTHGDDFFIVFSGRMLSLTFVEKKTVIRVDSAEVGLIQTEANGVINIWKDKKPDNPIPDCVFKRIDDHHMLFGMYDFGGPMRRMKDGERIPSKPGDSERVKTELPTR